MRDARGLHSDLKKAASLELLHLQQVEAEEQSATETAPDSGLKGSIGSAVKGHLLGRKPSRGECCSWGLAIGCSLSCVQTCLLFSHAGKETLLPKHQRTSSQGSPSLDRQSSSIKAVHSRCISPVRGSVGLKSPIRDTQHRLHKTQKLLDVLQFGQLHEQVSGQQTGHIERFLVDVLAAQDYRNAAPAAVKQIPPLRKIPELQSLLPPDRRYRSKSGSKHIRDKDSSSDGYMPLIETASSTASVGLMEESQLQETAPVIRLSAELLRSQIDAAPSSDCSKPQAISM